VFERLEMITQPVGFQVLRSSTEIARTGRGLSRR
jgi:hypothetical protein